LAMGDRLIYRDTFGEALADLRGASASKSASTTAANTGSTTTPSPASAAASAQSEAALADRLARLREQAEQLVRELDEMQKEVRKR
jgi:uncharacterized membrane protein (UPF0182 family)